MSETIETVEAVEDHNAATARANELRSEGHKVSVKFSKTEGWSVSWVEKAGAPASKPKFKAQTRSGFSGWVPFGSKAEAEDEFNKLHPSEQYLCEVKGSGLLFHSTRDHWAGRVLAEPVRQNTRYRSK